MAKESIQKKKGRVRPPRVHIAYDVELGGAQVMKDEAQVTLLRPKRPTRSAKRKALQTAEDDTPIAAPLFELLRKKRRELAAEREIPPYLIANDRTLTHLAAHQPQTPETLLATPGIGEKKAADLGPIWLEIIRDWLAAQPKG